MTTLLVCLLECAGFDCAITIIKWRIDEYTHVFAEVWYNNDWFVLDPTLKENGFGKQDKDIKHYKRITKKDMAKLVVLADGENSNSNENSNEKNTVENNGSVQSQKRFSRRKRCCPDSSSNNNININFGTNVENSHNRNIKAKPVMLPDADDTVAGNVVIPNVNVDDETWLNALEKLQSSSKSGGFSKANQAIIINDGSKPRNYIVPNKNRSGYIEFP